MVDTNEQHPCADASASVQPTEEQQQQPSYGFREPVDLGKCGHAATALPCRAWMMENAAWAGKSAVFADDGTATCKVVMTGQTLMKGHGIVWTSGLVPRGQVLGTCRTCRDAVCVEDTDNAMLAFSMAHEHPHATNARNDARDNRYEVAEHFGLDPYEADQVFKAGLLREQGGVTAWVTDAMSGAMGICTCCSRLRRFTYDKLCPTDYRFDKLFAEHMQLHRRQIEHGEDKNKRLL